MYIPQEDSYLLLDQVRKHARGRVLDMGTGSGILALCAAGIKRVTDVLGVDIDSAVIKSAKKDLKHFAHQSQYAEVRRKIGQGKVAYKVSDLFSKVNGEWDTIVFNPPYLPQDKGIDDVALYGGKHGYELIDRFLRDANKYLHSSGSILLLFSSRTNKKKVEELIENNLFDFEMLVKHHQFFEELYVYKLTKKSILRVLEGKGVTGLHYFDKGRRGVIFVGRFMGKKVAVKIKRQGSAAVQRMKNEATWLRRLNKKKIGPTLLFSGNHYLVYEFVKGEFILDYLAGVGKRTAIKVLHKCLDKCFVLDHMNVDKMEMHHPTKHILVGRAVTFIDFERTKVSLKPKNVTGFCQFIQGSVKKVLAPQGIKIKSALLLKLAQDYKRHPDRNHFKAIKDSLV